ncbi:hypothetical protein AB0C29_46015, partial [Actinoplanes sp. NPDC048791]
MTAPEDVTDRRDAAPGDDIDRTSAPPAPPDAPAPGRRIGSIEILAGLLVLLVVFRNPLAALV